jgi:GTP-binding protein
MFLFFKIKVYPAAGKCQFSKIYLENNAHLKSIRYAYLTLLVFCPSIITLSLIGMVISSAQFILSSTAAGKCPPADRPEFAFIGRSNVGKSSLINALVARKNLAKTSAKPGKTQTINHFIINQLWYLVDLPGYGFASVSQSARYRFSKMIEQYLTQRENLYCTFILLDSRLEPQRIDADFIQWMGEKRLPLALVFTKADKCKRAELAKTVSRWEQKLLQTWQELPPLFITSSEKKTGRDELLHFIAEAIGRPH